MIENKATLARKIGFWAGLIGFFAILFFVDLEPGKPQVTATLAVSILMAVWWLTEAIPIPATSLLPVALFPILGIMDGKAVSSTYFNHIIFLFIGGFLVAIAMQKWNLHKRIAVKIVKIFGVSQSRILLGFMAASAFLSMWMSNTATTMMMVPIVMSVVYQLEEVAGKEAVEKYATGLFLGLAYSSSIGGVATLVGTPPNLVFAKIFKIVFPQGPDITFSDWMIFALPTSIVMFIVAYFLLYYMFKPKQKWNLDKKMFDDVEKELGPTTAEERVVFILFVLMGLLWIFRKDMNIGNFHLPGWSRLFKNPKYFNDGTVAIFISVLMFIIPAKNHKGQKILDWDAAKDLPWGIVLLFGGGFALAEGFVKSGLSQWFANSLTGLVSLSPIVMILLVSLFVSLLTQLTSNTATTQILLPVLAGSAVAAHINPLMLMIPATMAASLAFMTPVATPPNAIVFCTSRVNMKDMLKAGLVLNIVGVLIITVMVYFIAERLLHIDFSQFPDWANYMGH